MKKERENLGARVAQNVKKTVERLTADIRIGDEEGLAFDLLSFVHDMTAEGMDNKVREEFFDEISNFLPGKECLKLEMALNKASEMMGKAVIWRVLSRANKIVGVTKEEKGLSEVTVLDSPFEETLSTARKGKKRGRKTLPVTESGNKDYASSISMSFFRELECYMERGHSQWFRQLAYAKQQKLIGELLEDTKGKRAEDSVKKSIIQFLPLLWRGGLIPEKGLDEPELIFFVVKEIFESAESQVISEEEKKKIQELVNEIMIKDKLGKNVIWLIQQEMQETLERIDLPDLGLIIVGYQRGKFKGALQSTVENLIEKVEAVLPEALVRRLFQEEKEKTE